MSRRAWPALALVSVLAVGGCGIPDKVVGLHPAPTENAGAAAFTASAARQISQRALDVAHEAMTGTDKDASARKAALVGPALRLAEVPDKYVAEGAASTFTLPPSATLLGVSRGRDWPRYILTTAQDDGIQSLFVLVQPDAATPFKLQTTVPMEAGASVPALPKLADGVEVVTSGTGLVASPQKVVDAYAAALTYPTKSSPGSSVLDLGDAFAKGILASSADQAKALGKLGTFRRGHSAFDQDTVSFELADGSALSFVQLSRRDRLTPTSKARELVLSSALAKLAGTRKVTEGVTLDWLETLAIVIPTTGKAHIIAASEQLRDITAK
ncbi:MAG: hypothetical protein U0Q21_06130 [Dermatophilaceae bacterium]